jgi:hypothetical protein
MGIFGKSESKPQPQSAPKPAGTAGTAPAPKAAPPAAKPASSSQCVIGSKTLFKGEISGDEDILVEGTVEGRWSPRPRRWPRRPG